MGLPIRPKSRIDYLLLSYEPSFAGLRHALFAAIIESILARLVPREVSSGSREVTAAYITVLYGRWHVSRLPHLSLKSRPNLRLWRVTATSVLVEAGRLLLSRDDG